MRKEWFLVRRAMTYEQVFTFVEEWFNLDEIVMVSGNRLSKHQP